MKVWLDILTPKQANFLAELEHALRSRGNRTYLTTRRYREVNELLELKGLKAEVVGVYGGTLKEKLVESSRRIAALTELMEKDNPDKAISCASPEAARVAFGLKIPHYCICDSPHAEAVSRLTIPLSMKLFTPWVIPTRAWERYGIQQKDIIRYHALDPVAWLNTRKPKSKLPEDLALDSAKPIITVRSHEEHASYLSDGPQRLLSTAREIVAKILELHKDGAQIVVLPRYNDQAEAFKKRFGDRVIVSEHVVDTIPLLQASSVFIGGGGTMTAEAALLGIPVISCYPAEPTYVERFLIRYGLVERVLDPVRVANRVNGLIRNQDLHQYCRARAAKLLATMEDPLPLILRRILRS